MLRPIDRYEDLAPLLSAQLRPGVATNVTQGRGDFQREIEAGSLFISEHPGALLVFRQRAGFLRMGFYLQKGAAVPDLHLPQPAVMEIASRPRDKALQAALAQWEQVGFARLFTRRRLVRVGCLPARPGPAQITIKTAGPGDLAAIEEVLAACFDPLTGCLPTKGELQADAAAGRVFFTQGGVLHVSPAAGGTQLRHLGVQKELRRHGVAQALFHAYMEKYGRQPSRCWVREDNAPACRFYEKNGYTAEEWASVVCLKRKDGD